MMCVETKDRMFKEFEKDVWEWIKNQNANVGVDYQVAVNYSGDGFYVTKIQMRAMTWDVEKSCKENQEVCKEWDRWFINPFMSEADIRYCKGGPENPRK